MLRVLQRWRPKWRSEPEFPILFLGLDAAGKSTVLYGLKLGEVVTTVPTIGFNLETIERNGLKINCWDVGGCDKIRPLWRHFTEGCVAVVFVVDANDRERLAAARQELQDVLRDVASGVPVLVLANKQDLPNALPAAEVARLMWLAPPQPPLQQQQRHPTPEQAILTAQVSIASPASSGEGSCNDGGGSGADAAAAAGPAPGPRMSEEEWYFRDLISRHAVHVQPTCALRLFGVLEGFDWLASALDHARQQGSGSGGAANVNGSSNAGSSLGLLRAVMPAAWRSRRQARQRQQARQPTEQQQQQQQRSVIHRWAAVAMRGAAGGSHAYGASTGAATATKNTSSGGANVGGGGSGPVLPSAEERLSGWLAEPVAAGDSDDAFLASLEACEPGVRWDHFAHLRLAWLYLVRYGRSQGAARIFQAVQRYIQHGVAGGGGRTFHTTMTFFWMHMVHYALASSQLHTPMVRTSFRAFLIANPHLADSGLFLRHYSRARMLHDPAARTALLLPDLQPLPSLVTDVEARKREQAREKRVAVVAGAAAAAVVGTPRLLARAAGVAAGWGVRGDRSSGGGSVSLRREEDGVLSAAYRRSSTSSGSTSNSTRSGGRLRSDGGQRATAGAARGWHNRLPAAAAAATRDEDLLAAVLQHLPGRAAATATSGSLGQALPSSGLRQQAQGGSKVAVGLRHNYEGRGDGGVGHASSGSPSPSLLSGWGSDTLPRVAYAAIRHHGYARASELLQAAAAAAATTRGQASTEESSDGGTLESPPALAEAAAAASAETRPHVKRAGDLGSLLGMDVSQLQEVVRDVARGIAARLPTAPEPAPSAAAKSARALISVDVGDGKPRVGGGLKQGECSDDDEEEEEEEEWLNVGDHEAWGVVTALNDKALRVDGKDAELEKLVGSDRVPLMRAALPQYRLLFTSG